MFEGISLYVLLKNNLIIKQKPNHWNKKGAKFVIND